MQFCYCVKSLITVKEYQFVFSHPLRQFK